ncbi:MAG: ABC transporter permease [Acidimicrobiia bacterium]|nr:ABC transporter permease [Acidimicrobiia bacterium]MYC57925.1 ABC transporter permease [Acidimicrobiia bacterium]MYG93371.1 ABC transporter permease [Acidimicrobiia bacterium]MYI29848.1 ABC transporter permease [Acidimicrobiia bacterium]
MLRFFATRLAQLVLVVLAVTLLCYWMLNLLPGNPCVAAFGGAATEEQIAECERDRNLDDPVIVQWAKWGGDVLSGDFGKSYLTGRSFGEAITTALPRSLLLLAYSQILALGAAIPLGLWSGYKQNSLGDKIISGGAFGLLSIPVFVLGLVLILVFAVRLDWFDLSGYQPISEGLVAHFRVMFLPSVALAAGLLPVYLRLLRTDVIGTLREDFVGTAQAKGLPVRHVLLRHVLRPSSFTLMTIFGIQAAQAVNGAIVVEFMFDLDGVGSLLVAWVAAREFLLVQTLVAVIAVVFVTVTTIVDLLYAVLDPRVRRR